MKKLEQIDKQILKRKIKEYSWVTLGVMLVAIAFSWFLDPYNLVIGGVSGLAIVFKGLSGLSSTLFVFILNIALLFLGLIFLGKDFFFKTLYGSLAYPVFIWIFDFVFQFMLKLNGTDLLISQEQMLLITLFSAFIMGFGLGTCIKHGGTTGGTDILQNILYKFARIPYSVSMFIIDGLVVLLGFFFIKDANGNLQYEFLLYEIIFIYLEGSVMDQIVFSGFNKKAVAIISDKTEEIKQRILVDLKRGVTQVNVIGGYTGIDRKQLICVLSSNQFNKLKLILNEVDPKAFYYVMRASEVGGEGFSYE